MNRLATQYGLSSDWARCLKRHKLGGRRALRNPSDIGRVGAISHERELLLNEQHFTIRYDDMGYSYEPIIGPYLQGAKSMTVEDPYIRLPHQILNFVRFCEMAIKVPAIKQITLITSYEDKSQQADLQDKLSELQQSLLELDVVLDINTSDRF